MRLAELADARRAASAAHLVHHHIPDDDENDKHRQIRQEGHPPRGDPALGVIIFREDAGLLLRLDQVAEVFAEPVGVRQFLDDFRLPGLVGLAECQRQLATLQLEGLDPFLPEQILNFGVGILLLLARSGQVEHQRQQDHADQSVKANISRAVLVRFQISITSFALRKSVRVNFRLEHTDIR